MSFTSIFTATKKFIRDIQDPIEETVANGKYGAHLAFRSMRYLWMPLLAFIIYDGFKNPDPRYEAMIAEAEAAQGSADTM